MQKIVIACDSFKGSLTSREAGAAVERGLQRVCPDADIHVVILSDGGEGLAEALTGCWGGDRVTLAAHDPLMRVIETSYLMAGERAVIELAAASGLPRLTPAERNPMLATTFGTGELIADALRRGCRHIVLGAGGSATHDAGTGILQALGVRFPDQDGKELPLGGRILGQIARIDTSRLMPEASSCKIEVACDVLNPMYGPQGAAHIFARQKGADDRMIAQLDAGLRHFAEVVERDCGIPVRTLTRAGAAGGTGGGLAGVLGASLRSGVELVLERIGFERLIRDADLVITGEGRLDAQTLMGKAPWGVLQAGLGAGVPVVALGGRVSDAQLLLDAGFRAVMPIQPDTIPLRQAMEPAFAMENLSRAAEAVWRSGPVR